MKKIYANILMILMLFSFVLAACVNPNESTETEQVPVTEPPDIVETGPTPGTEGEVADDVNLPEVDLLSLDGEIITAGSSTVFPLAEAIALRFEDEGGPPVTINSIGSGAGFERFCVGGEIDVANASRAITDSEVDSCRAIGREPIEFRVGTDALAVVISEGNEFLESLSIEELAEVFSEDAERWSDINPEWPDEEIQRFSPGTDSGTYDFFIEEVMEPVYGEDAEAKYLNASSLNLSEDDNVLVQGVLGSPYAIGYFGYAYYQENEGQLKAVDINGVSPTPESAESGEYPLARPLFIYSDAGIMNQKPQVAAYINFFLTYVNDEIREVGYFPASEESLNEARQKWLEAMN